MKEYNLGPNGGILTASNLFATRFDQVVTLCEKRRDELDYIFVDTPGQIEIFTWSASGAIVTESFASAFPTCVLYVVDTLRAQNPQGFHVQHAPGGLHPVQDPPSPHRRLQQDRRRAPRGDDGLDGGFEKFHEAVDENPTFASDLSRSLSLVLDAFYKGLRVAGVSAMTGEGMEELFEVISREAEKSTWTSISPSSSPSERSWRRGTRRNERRTSSGCGGTSGREEAGERVVLDANIPPVVEGSDSDDDDEYVDA